MQIYFIAWYPTKYETNAKYCIIIILIGKARKNDQASIFQKETPQFAKVEGSSVHSG